MARTETTKTELVWPGKYNDDGTPRDVPRRGLPFQVIETNSESRATRESQKVKSLGLFDVYAGSEGDTFEDGWRNKLIWGDNLLVTGATTMRESFKGFSVTRWPICVAALLVGFAVISRAQSIPQDTGAAGAWQKLLKVRTLASVMHVTAHPDDEHGGVLAKLSRGEGARVALLTLNRGESGDNAIGAQLFDALGLIRTEELLNADRYYGVDEQYFTTVVDYGFSKRLEESIDMWGRETVLRDVVRIVRMSRPWVILSRFQGNERDGHGNHQAAGVMAQEAFRAAGDPTRFPEQIAEGLRPWQPYKVYIGGVREAEEWSVRIDSGEYSSWLGDSYDNVARQGLAFQRSQNGGRFTPGSGPNYGYFRRVDKSAKESSLFDGLPTTYEALIGASGKAIDQAVARAMNDFKMTDPSAAAPALAEGLKLTREAMASVKDPEAIFQLKIKERQFQDALNATLGLELSALTEPPLMGAPVPGQTIEVRARLNDRGQTPIAQISVTLEAAAGWSVARSVPEHFTVTLADNAPISTRPYFSRLGLAESRYRLSDASQFGRPSSAPPLVAVGRYTINGVPVEMREVVKRREAKLPYGDVLREIRSVPRLAVTMTPTTAIVPLGSVSKRVDVEVSLLHNADSATTGRVALKMPAGWTSEPASREFSFARAGERASFRFTVNPGSIGAQKYTIEAVASAAGKDYREGYELIDQRDLEVRYLYRASTADVRGIDVAVVPGLKVGYVMGIGDSVPAGVQQLGAQVTLLGERELASADLSTFDSIVTGTRAYAVREDLKTYNQRLLDYVKAGGNMVVLYNTQEFVPTSFAPYPGELPRSAEEVSEENSPVTILAPTEQALTWPNKITLGDFDGWVEQRGSKFFTAWDKAYTPMISTFDKNQPPQSGGWLTAKYGKGTWTYFAYALHRQLPYGVAGAYRITANLLALGRTPR